MHLHLILFWTVQSSLLFQLFESSGIGQTLLAEIYLAIPEANITTETVKLEEVEFSGDQKIQHSHEGVGSGKLL